MRNNDRQILSCVSEKIEDKLNKLFLTGYGLRFDYSNEIRNNNIMWKNSGKYQRRIIILIHRIATQEKQLRNSMNYPSRLLRRR